MHRLRRRERCTRTNAAVNTAADTGAWRSDQTTGHRPDSRHDTHDNAEPVRSSWNTANKSDGAARNDDSWANSDDATASTYFGANTGADTFAR